MKIILIRQADTGMRWAARYDAASFERALEEEGSLGAAPFPARRADAAGYRVCTGTAPASGETAEGLFDLAGPPEKTPLLDDVPLRAFCAAKRALPLWLWRRMGVLQWLFNSRRQPEGLAATVRRVRSFVELLEASGRDCVVVCRGLTFTVLRALLLFRGYTLEGGGLRPKPLDRVRAAKRSLHCGGCHHNCLLSAPKCRIGENKARQRDG